MSAPRRIETPFGERSTADEVAAGIDLSGRRAIVTGASSGIGVETARVLAERGAEVTLAVRDTDAGAAVAASIRASTGTSAVTVRPLELVDPASVAVFIRGWDGALDILINNAGVMAIPERTLTAYGAELHFATNHIGHFLLTTGLHDALRASGDARVVSLSSSAHLYCPVLFDDPTFAFVPYTPFLGYGQSKTANVLFAVEASRRWQRDGIIVNAVMPGGIATRLQRHIDPEALARARRESGASAELKTVEQGGRDDDSGRRIAAARWSWGPLSGGLPRGGDRALARRLRRSPRRRGLRARARQRRTPLGPVGATHARPQRRAARLMLLQRLHGATLRGAVLGGQSRQAPCAAAGSRSRSVSRSGRYPYAASRTAASLSRPAPRAPATVASEVVIQANFR
jgi:NAD(P)-dependent dehydrogenase (short-subunit alcohol dehydrogenase family)